MSTEKLNLVAAALAETATILILPHNDPDPDAVASAIALRFLLEQRLNVESKIVYHGIIGRAENKALVDYLGQPLEPLPAGEFPPSPAVALVDTQAGGATTYYHPLRP
jgi:nanoRNase/pAp phosphatase (c-di-AMP/oligoRNAs hydrolase)